MILCIPRLRPGALFILANKKKQALKTSAYYSKSSIYHELLYFSGILHYNKRELIFII